MGIRARGPHLKSGLRGQACYKDHPVPGPTGGSIIARHRNHVAGGFSWSSGRRGLGRRWLGVRSVIGAARQHRPEDARVLCRQAQVSKRAGTITNLREVLDFLTAQRQPLMDLGWLGTLLDVDVAISGVLQALGRNSEALVALEKALSLAASQGFVRTFVDEGEPMRKLLQQVSQSGDQRSYARELLRAFPSGEETGMISARAEDSVSF